MRSLDRENKGWVSVSEDELKPLNASIKTIYRWLAEGKQRGFFWYSTWAKGKLFVRLGGLYRVSKFLKIESWGVVAEIPLSMLLVSNGRRMVASAITTQDLQERSRYAANIKRSQLERKCFEFPTVDQLLNQDQTSPKMTRGGIRGLVHRGQRRIFVGRRFVPFGASQPTIAKKLMIGPVSCGLSRWTVSRHLDKLEVKKRQIMQAKPEYKEIYTRINQGATSWQCKSDSDISFNWQDTGVIRINEPNGDSSSRREGGHKIELSRLNKYQKAIWLPRCNIYDLDFQLTSMKYARYRWKRSLLAMTAAEQSPAVAVENLISPLDPPQEEMPAACSLGSAAGNQNKGSNFENSEKADCEEVSEDSGRQSWLDAGARLRALIEAKKQERLNRLRNL